MTKFKCKYCESTQDAKVFAPFQNPHYQTIKDPKYYFHIMQYCEKCGTWQTNLKQTPELIEELDHTRLVPMRSMDLPFSDPM